MAIWTTSNLCFSTKLLKRAPCVPFSNHSFPWYVLIWLRKRFQLQLFMNYPLNLFMNYPLNLFMNYPLLNMDSADKSASSFQERLVMNMDSTEDISHLDKSRSSLSTNKSSFSIDCLLGKPFHPWLFKTKESCSPHLFTKIEFRSYKQSDSKKKMYVKIYIFSAEHQLYQIILLNKENVVNQGPLITDGRNSNKMFILPTGLL